MLLRRIKAHEGQSLGMIWKYRIARSLLDIIRSGWQDAMVVVSHTGNLVWMNPPAQALFETTRQELQCQMHRHDWTWFTQHLRNPNGSMGSHTLLEKVAHTGKPVLKQNRVIVRGDGSQVTCDASVYPVHGWHGRVVAAVECFHTEGSQAVQEQQSLDGQEFLIRGLMHDFNNLIQVAYGYLDLVDMQQIVDPETKQQIHSAMHILERGSAFSRSLGRPSAETSPTSLTHVFQEAVNAGLYGTAIRSQWCIGPDPWLATVDPDQLYEVVLNLTVNAVQAMPHGGTLRITFDRFVRSDGAIIHIAFQDEGQGIDPRYVGRIFEPYFTTKPSGQGLGLAMARALMTQNRGSIRVDSTMGKGTTFHLYFPEVAAEATLSGSTAG